MNQEILNMRQSCHLVSMMAAMNWCVRLFPPIVM